MPSDSSVPPAFTWVCVLMELLRVAGGMERFPGLAGMEGVRRRPPSPPACETTRSPGVPPVAAPSDLSRSRVVQSSEMATENSRVQRALRTSPMRASSANRFTPSFGMK